MLINSLHKFVYLFSQAGIITTLNSMLSNGIKTMTMSVETTSDQLWLLKFKYLIGEPIIFLFQCIYQNRIFVQRSHLFFQKNHSYNKNAKAVFVYAHRQKAKRKKNKNFLCMWDTHLTLTKHIVRINNPELEIHETVLGQGVSMSVRQTKKKWNNFIFSY